jgi:hypothetical protein
LEYTRLDDSLMDALRGAGTLLADALAEGLVARGLPGEVQVVVEAGRVRVVSRARAVHEAEFGRAGMAPSAPMAGLAREAAPRIVAALAESLAERRR